jgi:hypothetical protein
MSFQKHQAPHFRGHLSPVEAERAWFAALLWRAFPSASENEVSERAAAVLGVSARQVRNWLRCEHDARWRDVVKVLVIAGGEVVLQKLEPRR